MKTVTFNVSITVEYPDDQPEPNCLGDVIDGMLVTREGFTVADYTTNHTETFQE